MTSNPWVPVVAAATGGAIGLIGAVLPLRSARKARRDDLIRVAVRDLLAEAMAATYLPGVFGRKAVRRPMGRQPEMANEILRTMEARQAKISGAKSEFDLIVDSEAMHSAADDLLEVVGAIYALAQRSPAPDDADFEAAFDRLKDVRLGYVHCARRFLEPIMRDERRRLPRWMRPGPLGE